MVQVLDVEDSTVDVEDITKFKLAFLMQFFVQHKQRFRFPRIRLQDLYQHVLVDPDTVPLCDCVARILRFLRHRDPAVCIASVDEALDVFVNEKRTTHRQALQSARGGRSVSELDAPSRALLLEHLIECVYDERPELSFNAVLNAPKGSINDKAIGIFALPDDESLLIKAGQDASGSSYYYMDDLRLYRETPQGVLSSHWSVAVGPTTRQWTSFIASLGQIGEEAELCHFLQHELFSYVQECIENPGMIDFSDELNSTRILGKEAAELTELRRSRGLPLVGNQHGKPSSNTALQPPSQSVPTVIDAGDAGSSSGNSTSTCPLTPPNGTHSALGVSRVSAPASECAPDIKECLTAPNTPCMAIGFRYHHPSSVEPQRPVASPQDCKTTLEATVVSRSQSQLNSPLRRPASGPTPGVICVPHSGDGEGWQPHSAPPFPLPPTEVEPRVTPMTSFSGQSTSMFFDSKSETGNDMGVFLTAQARMQTNTGLSLSSTAAPVPRSQSAVPPSVTETSPMIIGGAPSQNLVFTSDLANEAAAMFARTRMRITAFHSMHPLVHQFMAQNSWPPGAFTQEQLEKRKSKMAQLEKIQSKLTKSKMASTPGAATVAAMQQQMYATGGVDGMAPQVSQTTPAVALPPLQSDQIPPSQQPGVLPVDIQPQSRGMMVARSEEHDFDRMSWVQHQRKHPGPTGDLNGAPFPYTGPPDHTVGPTSSPGGPPVLMVPPNNACGYPPGQNRFCVSSALPQLPPYKRPYPPEMAASEQQFWDQQQAMLEQQQQAILAQQQHSRQPIVTAPVSVNGGRSTSGRSGLSKKRKAAAAASNRSASARAPPPPSLMAFSGPQRLPQLAQQQHQQLGGALKSGGLGTASTGPMRSCAMPGDLMSGGYAMNTGYRVTAGGGSAGGPHVVEQSAYSSSGATVTATPPTSNHLQLQVPPGSYNHSVVDGVPVSSSSTQHLTSASLASLARLSQLSDSEGPFCSTSSSNHPQSSSFGGSGGYSRIGSTMDMLSFPSGAPGMTSNPDSDPNSLFAIGASNGNAVPCQGQPMSHPCVQGGQQLSSAPIGQAPRFQGPQMSFHHQQQPGLSQSHLVMGRSDQVQPPLIEGGGFASGDQSMTVSDSVSSSSRPVCATSTPPNSVPSTNVQSPFSVSSMPQQPPPSIQVNNTFFNAQLNVQQMNYQHVNANGGNAQMQIHFMQQRPCYGNNSGPPPQPPPPNPKVESRLPHPPTNVQITPKTPHTIQYLPSSSSSSFSSCSLSTTAATAASATTISCPQYSLQATGGTMANGKLNSTRVPSLQTNPTALNSMGNSGVLATATDTRGLPMHFRHQQQRGQKPDPLPQTLTPITTAACPMSVGGVGVGGVMAPPDLMAPDSLYNSSASKYPTAFSMPIMEPHQVQQHDNTNPFDFPQGATTYPAPNTTSSTPATNQLRGSYRDQVHMQYSSSSSSSSSTCSAVTSGTSYRVDSEHTKMPHPNPQMYTNEVSFQQQRWQHHQMMMGSGGGGDFYMQQHSQHNNSNGVIMIPQQQYYMPPQVVGMPPHPHPHQ